MNGSKDQIPQPQLARSERDEPACRRIWTRWTARAVTLGSIGALSNVAQAQVVDLEWRADPSCPRGSIAEALDDLSAGDELQAKVDLQPADDEYLLQFSATYRGAAIERRLRVSSCEEARRATVLLIQLVMGDAGDEGQLNSLSTVDADAVEPRTALPEPLEPAELAEPLDTAEPLEPTPPVSNERRETASKPPKSKPPKSKPPKSKPRSAPRKNTAPRISYVYVRGGLLFDFRDLPQPASGPEMAVGWGGSHLRVEGSVFYLPGRKDKQEREGTMTSRESEVVSRVAMAGGAIKARWLYSIKPFSFGPSLGAGLNWFWATFQVDDDRSWSQKPTAQVDAGMYFDAGITEQLVVYFAPDVQFALGKRPTFFSVPLGDVHQVPVTTVQIHGGLCWQF